MVPLSLARSQALALQRAPALQAEALRVDAARADALRAGQLPDPRLVLGIDNLTITGPSALELGADDMTMRRVGVMQDWPSRRKRDARVAQANAGIAESLARRESSELLVARSVATAWVDRWLAESRLALLEGLHSQLVQAVKVAEARLRGGEGGSVDVLAAKGERSAHENELSMARADIVASRAGIRRWLGSDGDVPLAPPPDFDRLPVPATELRASLDQQAALQVWDAREQSAGAAVELAQSEKRPDFSFGLSYGARSAGRPDMLSLEIAVALPVFPGNRQERDISARRAERDAVAAEREDARRSQAEALERELARWQGLVETTNRFREMVLPLAQDRSAVALAAYGGGGEIQPWLDARKADAESRLGYTEALGELARSWILLTTLLPQGNVP